MSTVSFSPFLVANADRVTPQLLAGGDLDHDTQTALDQLVELTDQGMTHIIDVRIEASDEELVAEFAGLSSHTVGYLHLGVDDRGQRIPAEWFETGVAYALEAMASGGVVLTHCHMGINRGPSMGFAILLAQGWDPVDALSAIRLARPIANVAYADDALAWHHERLGSTESALRADVARVARWRRENHLDVAGVIRGIRSKETRGAL